MEECYEQEVLRLKERIRSVFGDEQTEKIMEVYEYAYAKHDGVKRESGEPYIMHPVSVVSILLDLGMDSTSIKAGFLHDVLEDTDTTKEELIGLFGSEVANIVDGLTKLKLKKNGNIILDDGDAIFTVEQAENLRKLILAMCNDVRIIIIKLADRLHNMRTLASKERSKQIVKAKETLEIFAPLAARLGIMQIKGELEDLCFYYLMPEEYAEIKALMSSIPIEPQTIVDEVKRKLAPDFKECGIKFEISGRKKHYYSVYRKMKRTGHAFNEIYDLVAVRLIIDGDKNQCYEALGYVHQEWRPMPDRMKDYISRPKANSYSSLHTTVYSDSGYPFEVQIRTVEMHRIAEYGIAAHWKYKDGKTDAELDYKISWLRKVMEEERDDADSAEFLAVLRSSLFSDEVYVYAPDGKVFKLPFGATVVDFAYAVHSDVGNRCSGAFINGQFMPITTVLKNGDQVKIQTKGKHPSRDWLKIVKTNGARHKIKQFFKKLNREDNIKIGKSMLENEIRKKRFKPNEVITPEAVKDAAAKYALVTEEDLYAGVGAGTIRTESLASFFTHRYIEGIKEETKETVIHAPNKTATGGILVEGDDGMLFRLAKCCSPVPGDPIVGYISRGRGIVIHRADCANLTSAEKERLCTTEWASVSAGAKFSVSLTIIALNRKNLTADVCQVLNNMDKVQLVGINANAFRNSDKAVIMVGLEVDSVATLESVKKTLRNIKDVIEVKRS